MKQKTTKCYYPDWEGGIIVGKHVFGKDGFCVVCGELQDVGHPVIDSEEPKTDFQKWGEAMSKLREALLEYHPFFILARRLGHILLPRFFPNEANEPPQEQYMEQIEYVCEWCEPSDIPEKQPELCQIRWCPKHYCRTWHWPRHPTTAMLDTAEEHITAQQVVSGILNEDGYVDILHLGC